MGGARGERGEGGGLEEGWRRWREDLERGEEREGGLEEGGERRERGVRGDRRGRASDVGKEGGRWYSLSVPVSR